MVWSKITAAAGALGLAGIISVQRETRRSAFPVPKPGLPPTHGLERHLDVTVLRTLGRHPVDIIYKPAPDGVPTVIFFHGNAMEAGDCAPYFDTAEALEIGCAVVEYAGYGPYPTTSPTEKRITASCIDALLLLEKHVPLHSMILVGYSLGSHFAIRMAALGLGAKLVLVAPLSAAGDYVHQAIPQLPRNLYPLVLGRLRLDNVGLIQNVEIPTLLIHGDADTTNPIWMARKLVKAKPDIHFIELPGVDHAVAAATIMRAAKIADGDPATWPATLDVS